MKLVKNIFIYLLVFVVFIPNAYAFNPEYLVHTSLKDIEYKKSKALEWYSDNIEQNKFCLYNIKDEAAWLKARSLRWYENNVTNNKFYFIDPEDEIEFTKKKALRWYLRNSH